MKYTIVICNDDAGQNIKGFLDEFKMSYYEVDKSCLDCENIDEEVEGDVYIFATTHKSEKGDVSLTVHAPGNFGKAELGGKDKELCVAPASLIKKMYLELKKRFEGVVSLEVTHHGPFMKKPACFLEIGSSEKEWNDKELGKIIAEVLRDSLGKEEKCKTLIGIGGNHYPHDFNKILDRTEYAIGHICPKYNLENLDENMLKQMLERNLEEVDLVAVDWKGLGQNKAKVKELLEKLNIKYKKTKELRSV
ncbi:hypothetical protein HN681_03100 [archaeon]|jgi:D-aminoacyl-tRNA deacylase|nr:hypothetical protein [archaeon]MBT3730955.1 hypothetical protein [archaeon]MBT4669807.1 hypothetical protein [archaeon]MBT5029958.1 hypothetical protein [archaeon]MBT5288529.1 hypothetical protein [archaeon]